MNNAWTLQRSRRSGGWYYQVVTGRGAHRCAYTVGYLDDDEYALAVERLSTLPDRPERLAFSDPDDGSAPPDLKADDKRWKDAWCAPTKALVGVAIRGWLLDQDVEAIVAVEAEGRRAESARLEAQGRYGDLPLRDFYNRIWKEVRQSENSFGTCERENRFLWPEGLKRLGGVKMKNLDTLKWHRFLLSKTTWSGRTKSLAQTAYRCCLRDEPYEFGPASDS